jgi:glycosyltransferase involved in cell wall biosynthesis
MEKYLVISVNYPSYDNMYGDVFVHQRVKHYLSKNLDIDVFSYSPVKRGCDENKFCYEYDGVHVTKGGSRILAEQIKNNKYSKILIHFVSKRLFENILSVSPDINFLIWIHGYEALGWYRRIFNFELKHWAGFLRYILANIIQMIFMRKLVLHYSSKVTFIFVSEWMKRIMEYDTFTKNKIANYFIIPNIINEDFYQWEKKDDGLRFNILNIRSYDSKKYANDITVKVIKFLTKKAYFSRLKITLYGRGRYFNGLTKPLRKYANITIINKFLYPHEMVEAYKKHGIFLIPTRQDAQGVSMCEAMSSGLVPITSNNTAIPEYVGRDCGFLCQTIKEMVEGIDRLIADKDLFQTMSKNAAGSMRKLCGADVTTDKEIELITGK